MKEFEKTKKFKTAFDSLLLVRFKIIDSLVKKMKTGFTEDEKAHLIYKVKLDRWNSLKRLSKYNLNEEERELFNALKKEHIYLGGVSGI